MNRILDVFLTRSTEEAQEEVDDTFCCTVQSIEFDHDTTRHPHTEAFITERDSEWILPTWSFDYGVAAAAESAYADLKVGDLVRIGNVHTSGFSDYLTILERREISRLYNATSAVVEFSTIHQVQRLAPSANSTVTDADHYYDLSKLGISHIAYRVNAEIKCTLIPVNHVPSGDANNENGYLRMQTSGAVWVSQADRHIAYTDMTSPRKAFPGETRPSESHYYPLYKANTWSNKALTIRFDHGIKDVHKITLVGYSINHKRQVGVQHAHEMHTDDFLILRIPEIDGQVVSNNRHANGAFAVLQSGDSSNNLVGSTEISRYDPLGIVSVDVNRGSLPLRNLHVEVTDRDGNPAHFGRFHLWFKILTTHG